LGRKQRKRKAQLHRGRVEHAQADPGFLSAIIAVGLMVLVAVVFAQVRQFGFTSLDDPQYVSANPVVREGLSLAGVRWAWTSTSFYWHPLTWMSHMLDVELFGMDAGAHHAMSAIIHAGSTVLLFLGLRAMTDSVARSALVAALFAVHPLHVESVAWVAERKDVLSTFFWMAALYAYARYCLRPGLTRMLAVIVLFAVGLLAKPMIVTFPFALLLLDYWPLRRASRNDASRRSWLELIREKLPLFALALASVVVTLVSQRGGGAVVALEKFSWFDRIGNALVSYVLYLRDMIWPAKLAAFYPLTAPSPSVVASCVLLLALVTAAAFRLSRRHPYALTGWLWYLGTLVPVIGLLQAGDQGRADRFTYIPLVGVFIAVTWAIGEFAARFKINHLIVRGAAVAIIGTLAFVARRQVEFWRDDLSLWGRTVAVTSGNYRAENHYGIALTDRGMLEEGIRHYEAALKVWPDYPEAHNNLGAARVDQGDFAAAVREFAAASRAKPGNPEFRYNLAVALDGAGRRPEAIIQVREGLKLDPSHAGLQRAREVFGMARN
jgi:tetratricopeptide (TPR) repeat protein